MRLSPIMSRIFTVFIVIIGYALSIFSLEGFSIEFLLDVSTAFALPID